ncbi:MAG: peptidase M16 [Bacteroidetes bacterium]|nr:MAG: peptidase M16 [Bacteroidota bacterium]
MDFSRFTLGNGLRVLVNEDRTTPLVSMAIVYDVGASDEDAGRTGFAHLFEHLMFGGSVNIPDFDRPLELAGGTNNAFTNQDITCFYCTVPAENIETALWLDSDRMLSLAFSDNSLEVQRKVVVEEFKQNYLNAPYGDISHLLFDLAYRVHPYRWPTIGLELAHVEEATMEQVKDFFARFYMPNNAVLAFSGNISHARAEELAEKWFGGIPAGSRPVRSLPVEPEQVEARELSVERDVPSDALFITFPMCGRMDEGYMVYDVISDILSHGESSRFNTRLVDQRGLFSSVDAVVSGSRDAGLFMISGMLSEGVSFAEAEAAVWAELAGLQDVEEEELEKVKNKYEAGVVFSELKAANRARALAEYETLGGAEYVNRRVALERAVKLDQVRSVAGATFVREKSSTLRYRAKR